MSNWITITEHNCESCGQVPVLNEKDLCEGCEYYEEQAYLDEQAAIAACPILRAVL
jgi:hypothetical protein